MTFTIRTRLSFIIRDKASEILIALFLLCTMWARIFTHTEYSLRIASALLVLSGTTGLLLASFDKCTAALLYVLFMFVSWGPNQLFKDGGAFYTETDFLNSIFFFGIAYLVMSNRLNYKIFQLLYYVVAGFFILQINILHNSIREILADGNTYNYISCILLLYFCIYICVAIKNGKKPTHVDTVLLMIVIISSYGRGGIVSAFIYLAGFLFIKAYEYKKKEYVYIAIVLLIATGFLFSDTIIQSFASSNMFGKFLEYGLSSNGRSEIWTNYIRNSFSNANSFFFGANPREIFIDGNLHNSYLQMWATMGLLFSVVNIVLFIKCIVNAAKNSQYYYLLIMVTFFVRAFFDKMMFRWYGEILMYYFILNMLVSKKNTKFRN